MVRHSNDSFLNELARLFAAANAAASGSVQLTWKAYSPHADAAARAARPSSSSSKPSKSSSKKPKQNKQSDPDAMSDVEDASRSHGAPPSIDEVKASDEPVCLLHARLKDTKISTLVSASQRARFHRAFSALLTVQTAEQLLSKGEKRKADEVKPAESSKKKKKEKKAKSDKKPEDVEMSDASAPAVASPPAQPQQTRKERLALAAAKKKPRISKQQRRELRRQPNPNKDMEKSKAAAAPAASGSAKKASSTKGKK